MLLVCVYFTVEVFLLKASFAFSRFYVIIEKDVRYNVIIESIFAADRQRVWCGV